MPTIDINTTTEKTFVEFTRAFKVAKTGEIKSQPVTVALEDISTVRPSNRLGKANHRSTITMTNGTELELAEKYSAVSAMLDVA